jgi:chromate transporter
MESTGETSEAAPESQAAPRTLPFATAFWFWLRLGFISFGGPAGQIAIMHTELVERRRWISERRFLHALNYCMVLPGPEAQQLATYIGWLLHGTWGGIVAGGLFVLPSLFILMGLSWAYMALGHLPAIEGLLLGVRPAVVAIVVFAAVRIGRRAVRSVGTLVLAAAALVAMAIFHVPFPLIVLSAALLGFIGGRIWPGQFAIGGGHGASSPGHDGLPPAIIDDDHPPLPHTRPGRGRFALVAFVGLALWAVPLAALVAWQGWTGTHAQMGWFFTQAALVTFGGAYAVLPFVADHAISAGWLHGRQMIDGLALGETTPGPLIMVVAFVGFVGGWQQPGAMTHIGPWAGAVWPGAVLGCLVATYFTFLPSFVFILLGAPFIEHMRGELRLAAALSGVTAAVVGVVLNLAVFFGREVFWPADADGAHRIDWTAIVIAAAALIALWRFKVGIMQVVAAAAVVGIVVRFVGG